MSSPPVAVVPIVATTNKNVDRPDRAHRFGAMSCDDFSEFFDVFFLLAKTTPKFGHCSKRELDGIWTVCLISNNLPIVQKRCFVAMNADGCDDSQFISIGNFNSFVSPFARTGSLVSFPFFAVFGR